MDESDKRPPSGENDGNLSDGDDKRSWEDCDVSDTDLRHDEYVDALVVDTFGTTLMQLSKDELDPSSPLPCSCDDADSEGSNSLECQQPEDEHNDDGVGDASADEENLNRSDFKNASGDDQTEEQKIEFKNKKDVSEGEIHGEKSNTEKEPEIVAIDSQTQDNQEGDISDHDATLIEAEKQQIRKIQEDQITNSASENELSEELSNVSLGRESENLKRDLQLQEEKYVETCIKEQEVYDSALHEEALNDFKSEDNDHKLPGSSKHGLSEDDIESKFDELFDACSDSVEDSDWKENQNGCSDCNLSNAMRTWLDALLEQLPTNELYDSFLQQLRENDVAESFFYDFEENGLSIIRKDAVKLMLINDSFQRKSLVIYKDITDVCDRIRATMTGTDDKMKNINTCENLSPSLERMIAAIKESASLKNELERKVIYQDQSGKIRSKEVLISAANRRNDFFQRQKYSASEDLITNLMRDRYNLIKTIVHSEQLSNYYRGLLDAEVPYAVRKFRSKVRRDAPESELRERRLQTVNNVNTEIKVMRERVVECRDKVEAIDGKLQEVLAEDNVKRLFVTKTIEDDEIEIRDEYEKCYLSKRRKSDLRSRRSPDDHLLVFY